MSSLDDKLTVNLSEEERELGPTPVEVAKARRITRRFAPSW